MKTAKKYIRQFYGAYPATTEEYTQFYGVYKQVIGNFNAQHNRHRKDEKRNNK